LDHRRLLLQYWLVALAGTVVAGLALGIPTDVVPNPWFTRMTPVETDQYVYWVLTSVLTGALVGTYVLSRRLATRQALGSGFLGLLAVGCPVCNKLVVLLLGFSGAFQYFAPIQPYLGAAGVALAALALAVRLRAWRRSCALPLAPSS
jgi:hypothetical protein